MVTVSDPIMAASKRREKAAEFVACVVGLSRGPEEAFSSHEGVGKSCLCYRFVYPRLDDYVDDHQSLLALHEFQSNVINNNHFLYWGSVIKHFPVKGSKTLHATVQVHVIEHTVFYQDETSQPFPNSHHYLKRITGSLESPGKVSYKSRGDIGTFDDVQQYPSKLNKLPKGYMVALDISQVKSDFEVQMRRVEQLLEYLMKHKQKYIIVVTKRDNCNSSLRRVYELKNKYHTLLIETSASGSINVRDAFRLLAHKVFKRSPEISDSVTSFEDAQLQRLKAKGYAKRTFQSFLKDQITDPKEQLHSVLESSESKKCMELNGRFDTGWLFATHVLQLQNESYSSNIPITRQEFLNDFIEQRPDLASYSHHLKRFVQSVSQLYPIYS